MTYLRERTPVLFHILSLHLFKLNGSKVCVEYSYASTAQDFSNAKLQKN